MAKYRKKPVVIDAWETSELLRCARETWSELPETIMAIYETGGVVFETNAISIKTLEGTMRADKGDWVIKGVKGEFYPCKPDIFAATYEAVES